MSKPHQRETGFSLIEILVVVIVIGILAAIAIPVFSNQRKKANDALVIGDMNAVVKVIESELIDHPDAKQIVVNPGIGSNSDKHCIAVRKEPAGICGGTLVTLIPRTKGVTIKTVDWNGDNRRYVIHGYHSNGSRYTAFVSDKALVYDSANGGLAK